MRVKKEPASGAKADGQRMKVAGLPRESSTGEPQSPLERALQAYFTTRDTASVALSILEEAVRIRPGEEERFLERRPRVNYARVLREHASEKWAVLCPRCRALLGRKETES